LKIFIKNFASIKKKPKKMFINQLITNILLFFIGSFGILLNRRSVLIILMCIEIILLSVNLNFVLFSVYLDDFTGQVFSLFILTVAAAESAIGLAILILYFRLRNNISISEIATLKG
jgi:NADH-quinone oxidoreductase subunit K